MPRSWSRRSQLDLQKTSMSTFKDVETVKNWNHREGSMDKSGISTGWHYQWLIAMKSARSRRSDLASSAYVWICLRLLVLTCPDDLGPRDLK